MYLLSVYGCSVSLLKSFANQNQNFFINSSFLTILLQNFFISIIKKRFPTMLQEMLSIVYTFLLIFIDKFTADSWNTDFKNKYIINIKTVQFYFRVFFKFFKYFFKKKQHRNCKIDWRFNLAVNFADTNWKTFLKNI